MKRPVALAMLLAFVLAVSATSAATSSPATGDWSGQLKGVSPKAAVSFTVAKQGKSRRVVGFAANGFIKVPCSVPGQGTAVTGIPSAKVGSDGKFTAAVSSNNGFGANTTTVSGSFASKHAAAGTVVILIHSTPSSVCEHTFQWTAANEPPSPPVAGGHYKGATGKDSAGGGRPISFHVSANGKQLSGKFGTALTCTGFDNAHSVTGHNVAIHKGKFRFKVGGGNSTAKNTLTYIITGQFLSGRKAAGTTVFTSKIKTLGKCSSSNTWTAHA